MSVGFTKHDTGKLEYDIIPVGIVEDIIQVMMHGYQVKGYSRDNWKNCDDTIRYYNALNRHVEAWRSGEHDDPESGYKHLAHALCNLVFLHYLEKDKCNDKNASS